MAVSHYLRKIPHPSEQGVSNSRRSAAAQGNLHRRLIIYLHIQNLSASAHNSHQVRRIIILQSTVDSETGPERSSQQTGAGGSPDKGKRVERYPDRPRPRTLINHNVNHIIFHRRVQILLNLRRKPVNLIDEKHVSRLKRSQKTCEVTRTVKHRTRSDFHIHTHLICDDMGQGRLA